MKFVRILFQTAVLLVIPVVCSQPSWADTGTTLLTAPLAPVVPAIKSHATHRLASTILAGVETGLMGDVVPLAALFLLGRAVWMLIPSRRMEAERAPAARSASRRPSWIESESMVGRTLAALVAFGRPIWLWIITPRAETEIVEQGPRVEVPPLRSIPERITIF